MAHLSGGNTFLWVWVSLWNGRSDHRMFSGLVDPGGCMSGRTEGTQENTMPHKTMK